MDKRTKYLTYNAIILLSFVFICVWVFGANQAFGLYFTPAYFTVIGISYVCKNVLYYRYLKYKYRDIAKVYYNIDRDIIIIEFNCSTKAFIEYCKPSGYPVFFRCKKFNPNNTYLDTGCRYCYYCSRFQSCVDKYRINLRSK